MEATLFGGFIGAFAAGGLFGLFIILGDYFENGPPVHGPPLVYLSICLVSPPLAIMGFIAGAFVGYIRGKR
jgi:hypothetical protein